MHLVTLKNFKSYESQMIANINPRINVIIGKNGQGKSNFFKGTSATIQLSYLRSLIKYHSIGISTILTFM